MKRQRLNRMSPAERAELNRQLKDAMKVGLIRPSRSEFGSLILFVRKADGLLRLCIDYRGLKEVTRKDAYPLPRVNDTLDELKDANGIDVGIDVGSTGGNPCVFIRILTSRLSCGKFEYAMRTSTRLRFKPLMAWWNGSPSCSDCAMH
jgi:hypothetical protein